MFFVVIYFQGEKHLRFQGKGSGEMDEMWGHFHFCWVKCEKQNKEKVEGGGGESSFHVFSCKIVVFNHFLSMHGRAEIGKRCHA